MTVVAAYDMVKKDTPCEPWGRHRFVKLSENGETEPVDGSLCQGVLNPFGLANSCP